MHVKYWLVVTGILICLQHSNFVIAKEQHVFKQFKVEQPKKIPLAPAVKGMGINGQIHDLADYKGKVVLLHFWASFCLPCLHELPQLQKLWQQSQAVGLEVISVALDRGSTEPVKKIINKLSVTFPVIIENQRLIRDRYEIFAMPITYLINRDGLIIGRVIGARNWTSDNGQQLISNILKK